MLPMRSLRARASAALARNRFGLISFHDRDHGDGRSRQPGLARRTAGREGIADADGEVWLHCYPRVLGYIFKPVSFWYCHRADGSLAAVVVEVNNTFGERHCYLLAEPGLAFGRELRASKVFHVSPFCDVEGSYRFRFMRSARPSGGCDRQGERSPASTTTTRRACCSRPACPARCSRCTPPACARPSSACR